MKRSSIPWFRTVPTALVGLLALFALFKMELVSIALPFWALVILVSVFVPFRLTDNTSLVWLFRTCVIGFAIVTNLWRSVETINVFDTRTMTWVGELCAAELALACWIGASRDSVSTRPLWVAGLVMMAASSTPDDTYMIVIAPAFFFSLLVAVRWSATPQAAAPGSRISLPWRFCVALVAVLLAGGGISAALTSQRSTISQWGMQFLGERTQFETGSLSTSPVLSSTFGDRGSLTRALRIEGDGDFSHLRGTAYTTYSAGAWGPHVPLGGSEEVVSTELNPPVSSPKARVTRLLYNHAMVFAPLNAVGLEFPPNTPVYRVKIRGDMIREGVPAPSHYTISLSLEDDHQGPLCIPPTVEERQRLLEVHQDLDPRVRSLAAQIIGANSAPQRKLAAIEQYLLSNFRYSLKVNIGSGDPISNFLLERKAAHCEYFASAVVILARLAGVPSRYVIGYSGHERDGDKVTVVRQRDAHAWAECWVDGKGWITVDATPGGGRPDALTEKPSPLAHLIERIQDGINDMRLGVQQGSLIKPAMVVVGLALLAFIVRQLLSLGSARPSRTSVDGYTAADIELAAIFKKFEAACRRQRLFCPPSTTWTEYIHAVDVDLVAARGNAVNVGAIRAFLAMYNELRFGPVQSTGRLDDLRAQLETIQRATGSQQATVTD